jgi:hypothetical protein
MHPIFALFMKETYAADHWEEQSLGSGFHHFVNRIGIAGATVIK